MISIAKLRTLFGDQAKQAREILDMTRAELERLPACEERIRECYHPPSTADLRMNALNSLAGAYGVEGIQSDDGQWLEYLNTGDTYSPTITRWQGRYRLESWGDRVEILERRRITFA